MNTVRKVAVSVSELARLLGMSRARFYQLMGEGVFPQPMYDISTKRPFFDEKGQEDCIEVRRKNHGINGRAVMFYPPRNQTLGVRKQSNSRIKHFQIINALIGLGLNVKQDQVTTAIQECFPYGITTQNESEVLRQVFLYLKRQEMK